MPNDITPLNQVQPNVDLLGGMKSLADLQMAEAHASLFSAQARQANARQSALQAYATAKANGDPKALDIVAGVDPELAKQMQSFEQTNRQIAAQNVAGEAIRRGDKEGAMKAVADFPDVAKTASEITKTGVDTQKAAVGLQIESAGKISGDVLEGFKQLQDGKITQPRMVEIWNRNLEEARKTGIINDMEYNNAYDNPDPKLAQRLQQLAVDAKTRIDQSGVPAKNKLEQELPAQTELELRKAKIDSAKQDTIAKNIPPQDAFRARNPGALDQLGLGYGQPGAPTQLTPGAGQGGPAPVPAAPQPVAPATAPAAAAAPAPVAPTVPADANSVDQYTPEQATRNPIAAPLKTKEEGWKKEIPIVPLRSPDPTLRPGEQQGYSRQTVKRIEDDNEFVKKTVAPAGEAAQENFSTLSRVQQLLNPNGGVDTNRLAPARLALASALYGLTGDYDLAKRASGIDLANAAELNKHLVKAGLQTARQLEGAREAVAAINIALTGGAQFGTDPVANRRIIGAAIATAQWNMDRASAAEVFAEKQAHEGKDDGHYVGFKKWWDNEHSLASYTSKVLPMDMPKSTNDLKPNVTYLGPKGTTYTFTGRMGSSGNPVWEH